MATRQEFVNEMMNIYKNHGVYIGTANGELTESLTVGQIIQMENNYARRDSNGNPLWYNDAKRDFYHIGDLRAAKYDLSESRAGDCSGQIVGAFRRLGLIAPSSDYRAKDFQTLSDEVELKDLQPADFVFDKRKGKDGKGTAGHIGVYVGDGMVVDSRGRDVGVIYKPLSDYKWAAGGRLDWFSDTIPPLTRNLKYVKDNLMRGEDVKQCQERLIFKGFPECGEADGVFGSKTDSAVRHFQASRDLEIDGIVGQVTWTKLWE